MITGFKHKGLKKLYEDADKSKLRKDIAKRAELYLTVLDTAEVTSELDIAGFHFHALTGDLKGFYSVKMSRNHRMIFRFEHGDAYDVDLVDYH